VAGLDVTQSGLIVGTRYSMSEKARPEQRNGPHPSPGHMGSCAHPDPAPALSCKALGLRGDDSEAARGSASPEAQLWVRVEAQDRPCSRARSKTSRHHLSRAGAGPLKAR
jgi:hypothetical protein